MFDGINTIFSWVFAKFLPWNRYIFYLSTPKINGLCALALAACSRRLGEKRRVQKKNSRIQTTQNKLTVILAFYFVYIMILHNCLGRQTFLVYIYIYWFILVGNMRCNMLQPKKSGCISIRNAFWHHISGPSNMIRPTIGRTKPVQIHKHYD